MQAVSAERGSLVTLVGIINGGGSFIPPVYVYPRMRYTERFLNECFSGSIALNNKSGWMTSELFVQVLMHVKKHVLCSTEKPILLLLDNHVSHISLEAILYARENGIVMLSFPPHTSHKLQPLDVGVFGPFKRFCKVSFNDYLCNNPGKKIDIYDIAKLTQTPFLRAFTPENILKSFKSTGIVPFNSIIFDDADFIVETELEVNLTNSKSCVNSEINSLTESNGENDEAHDFLTPEQVRPLPRIQNSNSTSVPSHSRIITSSPEKNRAQEKVLLKSLKENNKKQCMKKKKNMKKTKQQNKKRNTKKVLQDSSTSADDLCMSLAETSLSSDLDEGILTDREDGEDYLIDSDILNEGNYVLVKFEIKSKEIFYVGRITDKQNTGYIVSFLKKYNKVYFCEPQVEDVSFVMRTDIKMKLPEPTHPAGTSRASTMFLFNIDLSEYNVR